MAYSFDDYLKSKGKGETEASTGSENGKKSGWLSFDEYVAQRNTQPTEGKKLSLEKIELPQPLKQRIQKQRNQAAERTAAYITAVGDAFGIPKQEQTATVQQGTAFLKDSGILQRSAQQRIAVDKVLKTYKDRSNFVGSDGEYDTGAYFGAGFEGKNKTQQQQAISDTLYLIEGYYTPRATEKKANPMEGEKQSFGLPELTEWEQRARDPKEAQGLWDELQQQLAYVMYSGTYTESEAQSIADRVYKIVGDYQDKVDDELMQEAMQWSFGESSEDFMKEWRYQNGYSKYSTDYQPNRKKTTRESVPYRTTEELLSFVSSGGIFEYDSKRGVYTETTDNDKMAAGLYLANKPVTAEEYDRIINRFNMLAQNGKLPQETAAEWIAIRRENGLLGNTDGINEALTYVGTRGAGEVAVEGVDTGLELATQQTFGVPAEALDQWMVRASGYLNEGVGGILTLMGFDDAGETLASKGREQQDYTSRNLVEAEQIMYNEQREYNEALSGVQNKVVRWLEEFIPGLTASAIGMGASAAFGGSLQMGTVGFAGSIGNTAKVSSRALNATQFSAAYRAMGYSVKNARLLAMAGNAALNTYGSISNDERLNEAEKTMYALADGAAEFFSEKLFDGNPLLDGEDAGLFTKWVYSLTDDGSFRSISSTWLDLMKNRAFGAMAQKALTSKAMDLLGEGLEEVISSVGMMAMDYAMYGKTDVTWESLGNDFASGVMLSMILSGGNELVKRLGPVNSAGDYKKIKFFTEDQQADIEAASKQMAIYVINYLGGSQKLMQENGFSESQAEKAAGDFQRILQEYDQIKRMDQARQQVSGYQRQTTEAPEGREQTEGAAGEAAISAEEVQARVDQAEGRLGDMDAYSLSYEAAVENAEEVAALWQEEHGKAAQEKNREMLIDAAANAVKLAAAAQINLDNALALTRITQEEHESASGKLQQVTDSAEAAIESYKNGVWPELEARTQGTTGVDTVPAASANGTQVNQTRQAYAPVMENGTVRGQEGEYQNGTGILDDGGKRDESFGAGGQNGAVAESTEGQVSGGKGKPEAAILADVKKDERAQSAKEIGVANGSKEKSLYVLSDTEINQSAKWKRIRYDAEKDGARAILFAGDMKVYNKATGTYVKQEGIRQTDGNGNTVYYIKVDKLSRGAEQIYQHEKFHELVSDNPGIWADLVQVLYEKYSEQEIAAMANRYAEAYSGIYGQITESMTEDEAEQVMLKYLEEMFADAYADIQRARVKTSAAKRVLASQTDAVQRAEENKRATQDTRGAPVLNEDVAGEQRYSIIEDFYDDNGNHYDNAVLLDTDLFDGFSPRNWSKILKQHIERRVENSTVIMPVEDENGNWQNLEFARISDRLETKQGNSRKVLSELYRTKDNISKLSAVHIDEVVDVSEESVPYHTVQDAIHNHGWIDKNGFLHRTAYVINAKNGNIYRVALDIAKTDDGRMIAYALNGKTERIGNVDVGSITRKVIGPRQNTNPSGRDNTRNDSESQEKNTTQRFSIEDDVAELDSAYKKEKGEDDTPEGMAPEDEEIEDYHALAREQKEKRAEFAKESTLKNRIKASENAIAGQRAGKAALRNIGALSSTAEEQIDKRIKLIRETMQIDRAALKKKQQARETEERQKKAEKQKIEIQEQKAKTAQKEARYDLLNLFSVKVGERAEMAEMIDRFLDKVVRSGTLTSEDRRDLFNQLFDRGEMFVEADEYYSSIRSAVQKGRIYVPESVREEFGDDFEAVRKKAWGNRIYLTSDRTDPGIDVWTDELAAVFGGHFDGSQDLKTQLETILELAEEGRGENVTIAEMMRRNNEDYGWSVEEQMDELERKVDRILETFAEKADLEIRLRRESTRKLLEDQEYFRRKIANKNEERMEAAAKNQVLKRMQRLEKYKKRAAPEQKREIDLALKDMDTLARSISPRGIEDLQQLRDDYYEMSHTLGEGFIENEDIENRLKRLNKVRIDDMSFEEVRDLGQMLTGMITQIQNRNKMLAAKRKAYVSETAEKVQEEIENSKGRKIGGRMQNFMQSHLNGKTFFGMISGFKNGATEELAQELSNGEERMRQFQQRAMQIFDSFMKNKDNQKWLKTAAGKDAVWQKVDVKGSQMILGNNATDIDSIELTPMMKVSLLMHSRNNDNIQHIGYYVPDGAGGYRLEGGGLTIPNKAIYAKGKTSEAYASGTQIRMPPEVVKKVARSCTEQEKAFADLLIKYFDGLAKNSINEVSLVLDGWERAAVQNYFPIQSDSAFIVTENELVKQDLSLQSKGFLKERSHEGTNPIFLMDASDVLFRNIDQVSKYYGLTLAIRDVKAVMNSTYYGKAEKSTGDDEKSLLKTKKEQEGWKSVAYGSVKSTLEKKWGPSATEYINKLLADLQKSERSRDALSGFFEALRGNYARAVISFNPSSVLKQTSSYPVAMAYLDMDSLIYGLSREHFKNAKNAVSNLEKYSAVYWYRNQGNATMELRDAMARKEFGDKLPLGYSWTQKMDSAVTRRLLAACEHQVQKDTKLTPGTQEEIDAGTDRYWTEVAKLFNKVVLNTQSNTSIMERPEMTRANSSNISRFLTMFRTDAYQQYNLLYEAAGRLQAARDAYKADSSAENKAKLSEARRFAAKSVTGVVVGQTMVALITTFLSWARFRDDEFYDEEGKFQWGEFFKSAGDDFIEGAAGLIMGGDILWSAVSAMINEEKWYGPEVNALETITDLANNIINLGEVLKKGDFRGGMKFAHDLALSVGTAIGIPATNVEKYLLAATKWIAPECAESYENFWEEKTKDSLRNESPRLIDEAVGQIMENRAKNTSDETKEEIARLYQEGMTAAVPTGIPTAVSYTNEDGDEVEVELSAKQRSQYRKLWSETVSAALDDLIASEDYQAADDEGKEALIGKLYGYANAIAKNAVVPEKELEKWVQQGANAVDDGVPLAEYIAFRARLSNIDGLDDNGESVTGLAGQRKMELLESMGWTDAQEKNVYLDVLSSDDEQRMKREETIAALEKAGMNWDQINGIISMVGNNNDRMNAIVKLNVSEATKRNAMMVYASDKQKKLMRAAGVYGVKMEWYMEVINNADEDESGSISQDEAYNYILSMNITWMEKAYLWQMVTDGKEGKSNQFSTMAGLEFWEEAHKDDE